MPAPRPVPLRPRITDASGRAWDVYEFSIHAGKVTHFGVGSGSGQYRGFAPVDGGARRRYLMLGAEAREPASPAKLLEQLANAQIDFRDDPTKSFGAPPERVDHPHRPHNG
jgi:hypothetical protein